MNNPLRYIDPSGFLTQAEFDNIISDLWNSPYGGSWSESGGMHYYSGIGEATAAGQRYVAQNGYGGGGSFQPVYNYSVSTSGRLGGFARTGLYGGPKFRWQPGNFQINFSSEIVGWEWVPNESGIDYSVGPWSNETLDRVNGSEIDYSAPGINLNPINPSIEGHGGGGGGRNNSLYMVSTGLNAASFAVSAGEYANVINGSWRGVNGKWYSTSWQGNQWTGARSSAISKSGVFKLAGRGIFVVSTGISLYEGGDALLNGDYASAAKAGLDIGMGAFATFAGPPGWVIGGGYFLLDAFGAFERPYITTPYILPSYAVPDNTYVAPPVIIPYP